MTETGHPVYSRAVRSRFLDHSRPNATPCLPLLIALRIALAVLLAGGCASGRTAMGARGKSVTRGQPQPGPARAARPPAQPDVAAGLRRVLAATDLSGAVVGPAPAGKEATLLVVFATWCGPCRRELALLGELAAEEPRLRIIGVNAYEEYNDLSDEARLRAFLAESAPWLQVVRADGDLFAALGRPAKIPTLFVFERDGALVEAYLRAQRRPPDKAELQAAIERAMRGRAGTPAPE